MLVWTSVVANITNAESNYLDTLTTCQFVTRIHRSRIIYGTSRTKLRRFAAHNNFNANFGGMCAPLLYYYTYCTFFNITHCLPQLRNVSVFMESIIRITKNCVHSLCAVNIILVIYSGGKQVKQIWFAKDVELVLVNNLYAIVLLNCNLLFI